MLESVFNIVQVDNITIIIELICKLSLQYVSLAHRFVISLVLNSYAVYSVIEILSVTISISQPSQYGSLIGSHTWYLQLMLPMEFGEQ